MNQPWGEFEESASTDIEALIRHMILMSAKSGSQVSRELGRSSNFIWSTLRNKSVPRLDLFVRIAGLCGYSVMVEGCGESYRLVPDDEGIGVYSEGKPGYIDELFGLMDRETAYDAVEVLDTFCTGYDENRLRKLRVADLRKEQTGYVFVDANGVDVARCFYDAVSGEPKTVFLVPIPPDTTD